VSGKQSTIRKIDYSNDGKLLAALDNDGKIVILDTKTRKMLDVPQSESDRKNIGFAFVPAYNWLVLARERLGTYGDTEIIIWDIENNKYIGEAFEADCMRCDSIAATLNKNEQILIAYARQSIIFNKETLRFIGDSNIGGLPSGTDISPDGNYLIYGKNDESSGFRTGTDLLGKVYLSDIKTNNTIELYGSMARRINDMEISQDGKTLVIGGGGDDGYQFLTVLDNFHGDYSENGLKGYSSEVVSVAISPDKKLVVASDLDGNVILWDLTQKVWNDWIEIRLERNSMDAEDFSALTFSQDSKYVIAEASSDRIYAWDLSNGLQVLIDSQSELNMDNADNVSEATSPDGTLKAVAGESTILIDTLTGQELIQLYPPSRYVKFSPDGKYLVTHGFHTHAYNPHPPYAWNVDISQWVNKVCQIVIGDLSVEEWKKYVGNERYKATCPNQ